MKKLNKPKEIPILDKQVEEVSEISLEQYQREVETTDGGYLGYGCKWIRPHRAAP